MNNPKFPTTSDIAEYYALLREAELLAKDTSVPVINLLWSSFYATMFSRTSLHYFTIYLYGPILKYIKDKTELDNQTAVNIGYYVVLSTLLPGLLYLQYQIWQFLAHATLSVFPSGIATTQQTLKARNLKNQLIGKEELNEAILELRTHINMLRKRKKYINGLTFATLISTPFFDKYFFGSHASQTPSVLRVFIYKLIYGPFQALWPFQYIKSKWDNYNPQSTIKKFKEKLAAITFHSKWSDDKENNSISSTLFFIKSNPKGIREITIDSEQITISNKEYINEIFRLCIEASIPVYSTSSGNIYIGYTPIRKKRVNVLRKIFAGRLIDLAKNNLARNQIKQEISELCARCNIKTEVEAYTDINISNVADKSFSFYISKKAIDATNLKKLVDHLQKCYGAEAVIDDAEIVTISYRHATQSNYANIIKKLTKASKKDDGSIASMPFQPETPLTKRKRKPKSEKKSGKKEEKLKSDKSEPTQQLPKIISWPKMKAKYDPLPLVHFFGRAYPLHIPWEKEGISFATIDNRVLEQADAYFFKLGMKEGEGRERVLEVIARGIVRPKGKIKSKEGGVGIVDSNGVPYKDVTGKSSPVSKYKIKIDNLRIFCAPANPHQVVSQDDQNKVLYHFNGIGLGH